MNHYVVEDTKSSASPLDVLRADWVGEVMHTGSDNATGRTERDKFGRIRVDYVS